VIAGGVVFVVFAAATSPVRVEQVVDGGCPSGAEVEQALASMLTSSGVNPAARDVAKLERRPDKLHVELVDPEGVVIAERTLDGTASCAELARMAAIVIASWESDVHPEFARQPAEIARVARAAPQAVPSIAAAAAPAPPAAAYDVAAGVTLGQSDTLAAGASIGGAWFPRGVGLGLWMLGAGDLSRTIAVGTHEARWRRWTASLEIARRWARDALVIDAHGGATLGWFTTEGVDYAQNRSASAVTVGGTAGIRMSWWISRHAAFWTDVRGFYFPRRDSIYGSGAGMTAADETTVPSWGGIASLGVAFGRAPLSR
jgi:hypothetical protein